jgi:hypothetical protein
MTFSPWDLALLAVVTTMGTLLAYLPDPRWKASLLSLIHLVRWLHRGLRLSILPAAAAHRSRLGTPLAAGRMGGLPCHPGAGHPGAAAQGKYAERDSAE